MPYVQPADISALLNSFQQLGASNAAMRERDRQAEAERRAGMAALLGTAGTIGGYYAGGPIGAAAGGALGAKIGGGRQASGAQVANSALQGYQFGLGQSAYDQAKIDRAAQARTVEAAIPQQPEAVQGQRAYDDLSALMNRGPGEVNVAANTVTEGEQSLALGMRPQVSPEEAALAARNQETRRILSGAAGSSRPVETALHGLALREAVAKPTEASVSLSEGAKLVGAQTGKVLATNPKVKDAFRPLSEQELAFYPGAVAGQVNQATGKVENLHFPTERAQNEYNNLRVQLLTKYRANPQSLTMQEQNILQYMAVSNPLNQLVGGTVNPLPGLTGPQKESAPAAAGDKGKPSEAEALQNARNAIKAGADSAKVKERIKKLGYDPSKI